MVEDPLKSLDKVLEPDPRSDSFAGGLAGAHRELSEISVNAEVPKGVQQLFATAKNVSLYSWFVYRFHQVGESVAFQALELALRTRCEADTEFQRLNQRGSLRVYLEYAASAGWLSNAGFSNLRRIAAARARMRKFIEAIAAGIGTGKSSVPEPSEAEIEKEVSELTYVEGLIKAIPTHRNELAHGSTMLSPTSLGVLRVVADILNQLYPVDDR